MHKYFLISSACLFFLTHSLPISADNIPLSEFPLVNYSQNIDIWLSPEDPQYKKSLLPADYQKKRLEEFYNHLFSTDANASSVWSKNFVSQLLDKNPGLLTVQKNILLDFSNEHKDKKHIGYGENFHPYKQEWIETIARNMDLISFHVPLKYKPNNRGIVVKNTHARMLPTRDPYFYHFELPGEGYPFDNLQVSALWVGTPVYIIGQTKDSAWVLVITPSFIAWIETDAVAKTSQKFVKRWTKLAKLKMAAITNTQTPITDALHQKYQFSAYMGSVFPLLGQNSQYLKIEIPSKDRDGKARMVQALVKKQDAVKMPLSATPENFSRLIKTLQNRPYGWGNLYFYNDCSAELQSLYTPFGIWLPRNSSKQSMAGKLTDLSSETTEKRLAYLMQNGHPLMTLVDIGGHIFMYLGNYPNPNSKGHEMMAMTYQNIWGLSPKDKSRRAVIGQSVLLPLLLSYPEDPKLNSLVNKIFFHVIDLDQWPNVQNDWNALFL